MAGIILASKSPRRAMLLRMLLDDFEVDPVPVNETAPRALSVPDALVVIARKKALAASEKHPETWILAADTVVEYRGELVGKARGEAELRRNLAMLADQVHFVYTGLALAWGGRAVDTAHERTTVRMDRLPVETLDAYVRSQEWVGKAGGYGIQDRLLAPYIRIMSGPWSNVVGLPLAATAALLRRNGIPCRDPPDEQGLQDHNPFDGVHGSRRPA